MERFDSKIDVPVNRLNAEPLFRSQRRAWGNRRDIDVSLISLDVADRNVTGLREALCSGRRRERRTRSRLVDASLDDRTRWDLVTLGRGQRVKTSRAQGAIGSVSRLVGEDLTVDGDEG